MAERATGPVKPPVIDLTARTGSASRPEAERPSEGPAPGISHRKDAPPRLRALGNANWPLLSAAIGGAVLGTILTYVAATLWPLPGRQPPPDLTSVVDAQRQQLNALQTSLGELQNSTSKTQVSLDATIVQMDGNVASLNKAIADLKASIPPAAPAVDLAPIETELKTLKAQVDAIAAGASGADASAIAQRLADLETNIGSLTTRLNGVDSSLGTLRTDLDASRKTLADHVNATLPTEIGPALKLPLILSGLESAFANGKPFQAELQALTAVIPNLNVPDSVRAAAPTGLPRPDTLMRRFEATLPDILAARDNGSGDWVQNATDWAKSLLALRPAEEQEGDSPEAVVSRLEGAMSRQDYATATALLAQLPARMQAAAAPVAGDIATHAAADQLVADLRGRALASADTRQ